MERLVGIEPTCNGVEFRCIIQSAIDAKMVSPDGIEPNDLTVMSGWLLPMS